MIYYIQYEMKYLIKVAFLHARGKTINNSREECN